MGFRVFTAAVVSSLVVLLASCSDDPAAPDDSGEPPPLYSVQTHPDSVVANFITAWQNMDIAGYRDRVLYDGTLAATDSTFYEPFKFYFAPPRHGDEFEEGEIFQYDEEVATATRILSGNPDVDIAGVESISLTMFSYSSWSAPQSETDVEGDPYPPGTLRQFSSGYLEVSLMDTIMVRGDPVTRFGGDFILILHVIPVEDPESPRYRLWKWEDEFPPKRGTSAAWSPFKYMYRSR